MLKPDIENIGSTVNRCGCYGAQDTRMIDSIEGMATLVIAYSNIVLNSIIYMLHYDVVKCSLMKWARETAAKLRNQPSAE